MSRFSVPVTVFFSKWISAPRRRVGLGLDVAVLEGDGGAELLQAADVEVDRPRPDGAAAGQGDDGLAVAGQQGPQDEDGRPHGPDELVGGLVRREISWTRRVSAVPVELVVRPQLLHQG